jgi:hypothetical protein
MIVCLLPISGDHRPIVPSHLREQILFLVAPVAKDKHRKSGNRVVGDVFGNAGLKHRR